MAGRTWVQPAKPWLYFIGDLLKVAHKILFDKRHLFNFSQLVARLQFVKINAA